MLLSDEERDVIVQRNFWKSKRRGSGYNAGKIAVEVAQAQLKKVVEEIEKYVLYVDARGFIALKPDATKNWQGLKRGME